MKTAEEMKQISNLKMIKAKCEFGESELCREIEKRILESAEDGYRELNINVIDTKVEFYGIGVIISFLKEYNYKVMYDYQYPSKSYKLWINW